MVVITKMMIMITMKVLITVLTSYKVLDHCYYENVHKNT